MTHQLSVGVFCGSKSGTNPIYQEAAISLGTLIGKSGFRMIFGGGNTGLMGSVSQAALKSGAPVTGIMPHLLVNREAPEHNLTELILTDSMSERKLLMFEKSDFFIVLPGGVGTLDESFEVVTDNWLKLFRKPLGFLNVNGFYEPLKQFTDLAVKEGFIDPKCMELCLFEEEAERLIKKLLEKV